MRAALVMAVMVSVAGLAYGGQIVTGVWGGYGLAGMADVNRDMDNAISIYRNATTREASVEKITAAWVYGFDGGYEVFPDVVLGMRAAKVVCSPGRVSLLNYDPLTGPLLSFTTTIDSSLIPLMVGGSYTKAVDEKLRLSGGAYFGYGWASANANYKAVQQISGIFAASSADVPFEGAGFVADFSGNIRYEILKNLLLGLNLNYMAAKIDEMKAAKDVSGTRYNKGDKAKDVSGNTLVFDYSNITVGLGIGYHFRTTPPENAVSEAAE